MTLREVEEATNRQVSNAYLSQIEKNQDSANLRRTSFIRPRRDLRHQFRESHGKGGLPHVLHPSFR